MPGFGTYVQLRQAEDVVDDIYVISPVDNPVCSMSGTVQATGKYHEWTEDSLVAAASNKHLEGADAPDDVSQAVVERGNYCQIQSKRAQVTGTLEKVEKYGRDSELLYQLELRYSELANDEELAVVGAPGGTRQTGDAGLIGTAREMASLQSQLDAAVSIDATAYTTVAELEAGILDCHLALYSEGGKPNYLVVNPAQARYISQFALAGGRTRDFSTETKLVDTIDILVNPYGTLEVILDRNLDDSMLLLDFQYLKTPVLRATTDWELSRTGDHISRQILRESSFAVHNSKACGMVDSVPTNLTNT